MIEIMSSMARRSGPPPDLGDTGPGPQELIGYYETLGNSDRHHGFFGEVPSSEFIDGNTLASSVGLGSAGTAQNNTTPWLKFLIDGKIVFVPKMTLRYSITWQQIYQAGCVCMLMILMDYILLDLQYYRTRECLFKDISLK